MSQLKLQVRITLLIAGLSLLFISIFASIQLNNHIERLNSYNKYRARVGTIIVKTTLEMLLKGVGTEEAIPSIFGAAIDSFGKEGIADRISVMSMGGEAVATNDDELLRLGYRYLIALDYLIFYKIEGNTIFVYRILHGARNYKSLL